MAATYKPKYGIDWPLEYSDAYIDMVCAKHFREPPYCNGKLLRPGEHLIKACRALLEPRDFIISPWTVMHAEDWCETDFCITWGGAACSKSNDYGLFSVIDWATDPYDTIVMLGSTGMKELKTRSYESVVRYFQLLKRNRLGLPFPGKESKTTTAILNESEDEAPAATEKAGIRGVAVNDGGKLQGAHLPYVRLILDELSEMKSHGMDARANLSIGCRNFKCFGLCNPTSYYDQGAMFSVPLRGWTSVDEYSEVWDTRWGRVRHHNGFQSPAILEPGGQEKYPHLVNQEQIDRRLREAGGNSEDRDIWVFVKGWPPRTSTEDTVLTAVMIHAFQMDQPAVWRSDSWELVAGLDPAFTSGGDACMLQIARVGILAGGLRALEFTETLRLPIDDSSPRPPTYQVVDRLRETLSELEIPITRVAVDDSGTQSVADVIDVELGPGCRRCNSGSSASDRPLARQNGTPVKDKFVDTGTELWIQVAELGRSGQIRNMPAEACNQFSTRRLVPAGRRKRLESKPDYKARLKGMRSPDAGDAAALCVEAARHALGLTAGDTVQGFRPPQGLGNPYTQHHFETVSTLKSQYKDWC